MIERALERWAEAEGARFAVTGVEVLDTVREKLEERRNEGHIDEAFFREWLGGFSYGRGSGVAEPEAVLLAAVPSAAHVVSFELGGRVYDGLLPPTYYRYQPIFAEVQAGLAGALGADAPVGLLKAPLKSLAVSMRLARYGRNCLTYVPGLGSCHQLCGYVVGGAAGRRLREVFARPATAVETALARCAACRTCAKACPAGAMGEDRFRLFPRKCNTLYSEARGPWPEGFKLAGSPCLVGCLACQTACPENKGKLRHERTGVRFSDAETRVLLELGRLEGEGKGRESRTAPSGTAPLLWASLLEKYDRLRLTEDIEGFARNLLPVLGLY